MKEKVSLLCLNKEVITKLPQGFDVLGSNNLCDVQGLINNNVLTFQGTIILFFSFVYCSFFIFYFINLFIFIIVVFIYLSRYLTFYYVGHPEFTSELMKALLLSRRGIIPDEVLDEVSLLFFF